MSSSDSVSEIFDDESRKLRIMIDSIISKSNLNVDEIVEVYYQVMNVSSMSVLLRGNVESESGLLLEKIHETEKLIFEQFDSVAHPQITKFLSDSISDDTKKLQSENHGKKSKEEIELDAKMFENLRQKMSTREFVEQYEKSLDHD
ncbi:hypothetical protein K0U27_07235 [archaeon]|nr:hypothetical protein [archaeon]